MTDQVDCVRAVKAPQPDLVNCAERSILAKQTNAENNCKGIFGDPVVSGKSGSGGGAKSASPLERFNMFVEGQGGKLRKRSEPLKAVIRPKFVKSASIARLLGNNYSTATTNGAAAATTTTQGQGEKTKDLAQKTKVESPVGTAKSVRRREKFQKCEEKEDKKVQEESEEEEGGERKVSFSECAADEVSLRGSQLNLMSHNSDIRKLRAVRSFTRGLGKLLRRRTDSVDISPPDPEYKVCYLGNVLTGWAKGKRRRRALITMSEISRKGKASAVHGEGGIDAGWMSG